MPAKKEDGWFDESIKPNYGKFAFVSSYKLRDLKEQVEFILFEREYEGHRIEIEHKKSQPSQEELA